MDRIVKEILRNTHAYDPDHHLGRPFSTGYQIAILFRQNYPREFEELGKPVGGKESGQHDSAAQYIAGQLSIRIRNGSAPHIEGAFLARHNVAKLEYNDDGAAVESSLGQSYDLAVFRLRDENK